MKYDDIQAKLVLQQEKNSVHKILLNAYSAFLHNMWIYIMHNLILIKDQTHYDKHKNKRK